MRKAVAGVGRPLDRRLSGPPVDELRGGIEAASGRPTSIEAHVDELRSPAFWYRGDKVS